MAVTFTENVVIITSDASPQTIASGDVQAGGFDRFRIRAIRWVTTAAPTQGDNAQILDASGGNVLWEAVAPSTAQVNIESQFPDGFELRPAADGSLTAVVDSGTLYLYVGGGRGRA